MNVFLMHRDRDFDLKAELPLNEKDLVQDLELETLFGASAAQDEFISKVAKVAILSGAHNDRETIVYRQEVLRDCLNNPTVVRQLYTLVWDTIEQERKNYWGIFNKYPSAILHRSMDVMGLFATKLQALRDVAKEQEASFKSKGFARLFEMLGAELTDEYLAEIREHLVGLKFRDGVLVSASLGAGARAADYVLHRPESRSWWQEFFHHDGTPSFTLNIHPRDETGAKALYDMSNRGLNLVANALAQAVDHILGFFKILRTELAFYVACLNLEERLRRRHSPVCFPQPASVAELKHGFRGLYDVCLALRTSAPMVGNELAADGKEVVIITGANQGGKSTFLRSVGLAQLMMQAGMFVTAEEFQANVCDGIFTHYKREEDAAMESGKFDEELSRMSTIVDQLRPKALILFNESFAATNEREGSEIAKQITLGLEEKHVKVFFVTHLFDFAHSMFEERVDGPLFLRAERKETGERTFKLVEGEPLQTSFGEDLYKSIFASDADVTAAVSSA
jgi:energy-coupling factor transporter ATP-binding protein EcfA2